MLYLNTVRSSIKNIAKAVKGQGKDWSRCKGPAANDMPYHGKDARLHCQR